MKQTIILIGAGLLWLLGTACSNGANAAGTGPETIEVPVTVVVPVAVTREVVQTETIEVTRLVEVSRPVTETLEVTRIVTTVPVDFFVGGTWWGHAYMPDGRVFRFEAADRSISAVGEWTLVDGLVTLSYSEGICASGRRSYQVTEFTSMYVVRIEPRIKGCPDGNDDGPFDLSREPLTDWQRDLLLAQGYSAPRVR